MDLEIAKQTIQDAEEVVQYVMYLVRIHVQDPSRERMVGTHGIHVRMMQDSLFLQNNRVKMFKYLFLGQYCRNINCINESFLKYTAYGVFLRLPR